MDRKLEMKIRKLGPIPRFILQKIIEYGPERFSAKGLMIKSGIKDWGNKNYENER